MVKRSQNASKRCVFGLHVGGSYLRKPPGIILILQFQTDDSNTDIEDHPLLVAALKTDLPENKKESQVSISSFFLFFNLFLFIPSLSVKN